MILSRPTEKMASILGVSVGDNVTLENEDGLTADFRVGGIAENYVMSYVYMTSDLYTSGFGTEPDYNVVLVKSNADAAGEDAETEELLGMKCVSSVSFTTSMSSSFENMLGKIDYIVIVLIISAGALVFVVLYNLTNINIAERSKELATIKVLGFFDGRGRRVCLPRDRGAQRDRYSVRAFRRDIPSQVCRCDGGGRQLHVRAFDLPVELPDFGSDNPCLLGARLPVHA